MLLRLNFTSEISYRCFTFRASGAGQHRFEARLGTRPGLRQGDVLDDAT